MTISAGNRLGLLCFAGLLLSGMAGCATTSGPELGPDEGGHLLPCPASPNCVSTSSSERIHRIAPFTIVGEPAPVWQALITHLETDPSYTVKVRGDDYIRAEARTAVMRFVDDVEFQLDTTSGQIELRSASRLGLSDLGTNRRRLERIRKTLNAAGLVQN